MCLDPRLRITVDEALNHPWIVKCNKPNYKESAAYILLQSFLIFVIICAIFSVYFFILSGYFDIEYHFISWIWKAACSLQFYTKDMASKSSNGLLQVVNSLGSLSSENLAAFFRSNLNGIENELWCVKCDKKMSFSNSLQECHLRYKQFKYLQLYPEMYQFRCLSHS